MKIDTEAMSSAQRGLHRKKRETMAKIRPGVAEGGFFPDSSSGAASRPVVPA
jgi:hypothetical protein